MLIKEHLHSLRISFAKFKSEPRDLDSAFEVWGHLLCPKDFSVDFFSDTFNCMADLVQCWVRLDRDFSHVSSLLLGLNWDEHFVASFANWRDKSNIPDVSEDVLRLVIWHLTVECNDHFQLANRIKIDPDVFEHLRKTVPGIGFTDDYRAYLRAHYGLANPPVDIIKSVKELGIKLGVSYSGRAVKRPYRHRTIGWNKKPDSI